MVLGLMRGRHVSLLSCSPVTVGKNTTFQIFLSSVFEHASTSWRICTIGEKAELYVNFNFVEMTWMLQATTSKKMIKLKNTCRQHNTAGVTEKKLMRYRFIFTRELYVPSYMIVSVTGIQSIRMFRSFLRRAKIKDSEECLTSHLYRGLTIH